MEPSHKTRVDPVAFEKNKALLQQGLAIEICASINKEGNSGMGVYCRFCGSERGRNRISSPGLCPQIDFLLLQRASAAALEGSQGTVSVQTEFRRGEVERQTLFLKYHVGSQ